MSRDMSKVHPRLQEAVKKLQAKFPKIGFSDGLRNQAEQDALYAKGRTAPGSIVTNVKYPNSQHNWGIAVDFFQNVSGNLYPDAFMREVAAYAKSIGLAWGGDWSSFKDTPHLYLPDWGSTTPKLKSQYGTPQKFIATWGKSTGSSSSTTPATSNGKLAVDGQWGKATTRRLQQILSTPADGIVSNQYAAYKKSNPGLVAGWDWQEKPGKAGSTLVKAIQKLVGVSQDGFIGPKTIRAMQKYWGTVQDGCISNPSALVEAVQMWCNSR